MTLLVASIAPEDRAALAELADRAWSLQAEAVEVRLDAFDDDPAQVSAYLHAAPRRTWIITCRSLEEGGHFQGDTMERVSRLIAAARGTDAFVDFEYSDWRRSENIRQKILLAAARPHDGGHRLILSSHHFERIPNDLPALVAAMLSDPHASAVKIAWTSRSVMDSFTAIDLVRAHGNRVTAIAMGEEGHWTRVLAGKFGAHATYAAMDDASATAPGQPTLTVMQDQYRWRQLSPETRVYGVIGNPVAHSLSPVLFAHWFAETRQDAVYLPIRVAGEAGTLAAFLDACAARPWLDLCGLSVTLPHKEAVCAWVGGGVDHAALEVGAVNTLVFRDGAVRGHNTDGPAAMDSLLAGLGGDRRELSGLNVDVLGTGGAARAVLGGLHDVGAKVTVFGRNAQRVHEVCARFGAAPATWENRLHRKGDVLINCTSVGLWPDIAQSPMPATALHGCRLVFDLIYRPAATRLLRDAEAAGIPTLNGLDMFVRQAAAQFVLWTGKAPDRAGAFQLLERLIRRESDVTVANSAHPGAFAGFPRGKPVVLIGYRGCGKSTVGRLLAQQISGRFLDTDEMIASEAGRTISEIFAAEGKAGFRARERRAVDMALCSNAAVVSVGGGAVLDSETAARLHARARVVWLTASPETLWTRIAQDEHSQAARPPLTPYGGLEEVQHVLRDRNICYTKLADVQVDTDGRSPQQVAEEVVRLVGMFRE